MKVDPTASLRIASAATSAAHHAEGAGRTLQALSPGFGRLTQRVVEVVGGSSQGVDQEMVIAMTAARDELAVAMAALAGARAAAHILRAEATLRP